MNGSDPYLFQELNIIFYDIAYKGGNIWYACDDSSYPVRAYNASGNQVNSIPSSVIPDAYGLCFDDQGYLWASDLNADLIYKINLNAVTLDRSTWGEIKASNDWF